jgi:hypothetical protein
MIDWQRLSQAMQYWQKIGYRPIEVPWIVPECIAALTHNGAFTETATGVLVGSAEQSFLSLQMKEELLPGRYVACSPCFRDDPIDDLHVQQFMKVEIYNTIDVSGPSLEWLLSHAETLFASWAPNATFGREITPEGIDITMNGVEIGSYGYREACGIRWLYGTGVAEPRFGMAYVRS